MNKLLLILTLISNTAYAACPRDNDPLKVTFTGIFDSTKCKYKEFKRFNCYPVIKLDTPLLYEKKSYTEIPLYYDNSRKHTVVKPYVRKNKTSEIKGCGIIGSFYSGVSIDIWELNDN